MHYPYYQLILNYNNAVNTDYFVDDKSFKKIFVKLNNNIRSYNLDSFLESIFILMEYFFFLLLLILINTFFAFYNYSKKKK